MTLQYLYNGVAYPDTTTLIRGAGSVTNRADGSYATGQAVIRDPTGVLDYINLQEFAVKETACTAAPVLSMGMIYNLRLTRGEYTVGAGREWTFEFTDLNGLLHERVLHAANSKRARETGNARMAWLLASYALDGIVFDHGQIADLPDYYDATDYRGKYADDVLQDLAASSVADSSIVFFVYLDQASGEASLFHRNPQATDQTSTLTISNVPGDADGITCFEPTSATAPELTRAGDNTYDGVYFTTKNGSIYRRRAATYATFGRHRDGTFSTDRISLGETADRHTTYWLNRHAHEIDTVTVTVRLPPDKVGLIQAGNRIQIRLQQFPGFTSWVYSRVTAASLTLPAAGKVNHYDLGLELSTRGLGPAPGGDPGGFPKPTGTALSIIQQSVGRSTRVLGATPTDDDVLVLLASKRSSAPGWIGAYGYTDSGEGPVSNAVTDYVQGGYKTAASDSDTMSFTSLNELDGWYEITAGAVLTAHSSAVGNSNTASCAAITIPAGGIAFFVAGIGASGAGGFDAGVVSAWTPAAGWVEDFDGKAFDGHPATIIAHYINATSSPVVVTPSAVFVPGAWTWQCLAMAFGPSAAAEPPLTGQWTYNEIPTPTPDGVTTTFTLAFPYEPGALKVRVDGVPILNGLTETNPEAGTFTLDFAPLGPVGDARGEIVLVDYQSP